MGYNLINWENSPSKQTPINAENLNQMDVNIAKAIQGTRFNFSATFTSDGVLKNTTSTEALGPGSFATSQTDIVTVFVADNVTKINNGAFSNCTSLKTIYIDNTVGNVDIVTGAVPSGVSIVYSNDENYLNVNELLASAIKSLKSSVNTNRTDWENRATSIETQHKTDVQALTDKANSIVEQANTDRQNFNKSVDEINTKLDTKENVSNKVSVITHPSLDYYPDTKAVFDYVNSKLETPLSDIESLKADKLNKTDFNSYKTSNDNAVKDNADNINLLNTNKADLVQSQNLYDWSKLNGKSVDGLSVEKMKDGSYHITGTPSKEYVALLSERIKLQEGKYYVSSNKSNTDNCYVQVAVIVNNETKYYTDSEFIVDDTTSYILLSVQTGTYTDPIDLYMYPCLCMANDKNKILLPYYVTDGVYQLAIQTQKELQKKEQKIIDLSIKVTTDKAGTTTISDSSNNNIVGLNMYGKTTQSTRPTPTNPVDITDINNPKITFSNDSDSQEVNIQCTLRGIGNVCDTLTISADGTGYITQRLFAERITSQKKSTSYEWSYSKATHRFFRNDYSYSFDVKDNKPLILCSHLDVGENEKNTAFDNSIGWINVGGVGIAIRMTEFDGDIAKFKKWLDDNEVYVVAPQSKPITVNLSKDEVDKILSLHTYYPSTTIVADCDCEVEYVADTKTYIDNKFNELATALVAHESEVI